MRVSDQDLRGRTVIGADGQAVGEVVSVRFDTDNWTIEALEVRLRKPVAAQLGASHGMFRPGILALPVGLIQSVGDAIVLAVAVDGLRSAVPARGESAPAP